MSATWHVMFWLALPVSMWIALWAYGEWRAGR
jgi:hypothetical protein